MTAANLTAGDTVLVSPPDGTCHLGTVAHLLPFEAPTPLWAVVHLTPGPTKLWVDVDRVEVLVR